MGITIKHGKPSTIISAAQEAGKARAAQRASEQAMAAATRLQEKQMEMEYRTAMQQQDMAIDLQMQERAKTWEIEKMELRSRMDFQREEQVRQRKLDSYDNIDTQLDKEVQAGRMTEKDAEPYRIKNNLARQGMNVSISDVVRQQEEERYGVKPYYTDPEFERDFPELSAAKRRDVIEGRAGTIPYHLSPEFLRTLPPSTAQEMLENKGIFFDSDEDFEEWLVNLEGATPTELPLGGKQLDIGVRAGAQAGAQVGTLDATTARRILAEVGGDRDKARQIARQRGYSF